VHALLRSESCLSAEIAALRIRSVAHHKRGIGRVMVLPGGCRRMRERYSTLLRSARCVAHYKRDTGLTYGVGEAMAAG
jgi:hypothetical protein